MKTSFWFAFTIAFIFDLIKCDVIRIGACPKVFVQRNFDRELFEGKWYEIAKNPMIILSSSKCNKIELNLKHNYYNVKSSSILK
jgi:lipocalin